jgi:hypothetical protein
MLTYNSQAKMNKPIKFFGLSPLQSILLFVGTTVLFLGMQIAGKNIIVTIVVFSILFICLKRVSIKIREAIKKGNPDLIKAYYILKYSPKKIEDRRFVFKYLIKHGN